MKLRVMLVFINIRGIMVAPKGKKIHVALEDCRGKAIA